MITEAHNERLVHVLVREGRTARCISMSTENDYAWGQDELSVREPAIVAVGHQFTQRVSVVAETKQKLVLYVKTREMQYVI